MGSRVGDWAKAAMDASSPTRTGKTTLMAHTSHMGSGRCNRDHYGRGAIANPSVGTPGSIQGQTEAVKRLASNAAPAAGERQNTKRLFCEGLLSSAGDTERASRSN